MYVTELKNGSQVRKLSKLTDKFLKEVPVKGEPVLLETAENVFEEFPEGNTFLIKSGAIEVELGGKLIYFFEPGDVIHRPRFSNAADRPIFKCSQDTTLQAYSWEDIKHTLQKNAVALEAWAEYLQTFNAILVQALGHYSAHNGDPSQDYLNFEPGDVIIAQGETSEMVFTLMEGHAEAFQDGVKVGDIYVDEIFGAMAAFTRSKRTASVIAKDECLVRAIKQEDFVELVRLQPEVCRNLIENMARQIIDLNETILSLQVAGSDPL